jgi:hypothetical protein
MKSKGIDKNMNIASCFLRAGKYAGRNPMFFALSLCERGRKEDEKG